MKKCAYCGNEFEPKKPKAIYCSTKCRTYAHRKKAIENNKNIGIGTIELPKDYVKFTKVGILKKDGTVETLNVMPKGLSITEQLEWRQQNIKK